MKLNLQSISSFIKGMYCQSIEIWRNEFQKLPALTHHSTKYNVGFGRLNSRYIPSSSDTGRKHSQFLTISERVTVTRDTEECCLEV